MKKFVLFLCIIFASLSGFAKNDFLPNPKKECLNDTVCIINISACNMSTKIIGLPPIWDSVFSLSYSFCGMHYYKTEPFIELFINVPHDTTLFCYIDSINGAPLDVIRAISISVIHAPTFTVPLDSIRHVTCPDGLYSPYADGKFSVLFNDSLQDYLFIRVESNVSYFSTQTYNDDFTLSQLKAGTYQITSWGVNGCQCHDSVTITQPEPWIDHVDEDVIDSIRCNQPAYVKLSLSGGTPPYTFNWKYEFDSTLVFPDTNELYFPFPGIYYSEFHDANGCLFNGFELAFVIIYELVVDTIQMESHDTIICSGEEIMLSAYSRGFGNHTWYVGDYSDSINYYTGIYPDLGYMAEYFIDTLTQPQYVKVTFVDENGCATHDSVWVDIYNSNISMTIQTPEVITDSTCIVHVSPPGGNLYVDDTPIAYNIPEDFTFSTTGMSVGEHTLKYAGIFGAELGLSCEDEVSLPIQVETNPFVTEWECNIFIYPNPATTTLNLSSIGISDFELSILDIAGKGIKTGKMSNQTFTIDVSDLASGIYMLRLVSHDGASKVVKFVKR